MISLCFHGYVYIYNTTEITMILMAPHWTILQKFMTWSVVCHHAMVVKKLRRQACNSHCFRRVSVWAVVALRKTTLWFFVVIFEIPTYASFTRAFCCFTVIDVNHFTSHSMSIRCLWSVWLDRIIEWSFGARASGPLVWVLRLDREAGSHPIFSKGYGVGSNL